MNRGESPVSSQGASFTDIGESPFRDAIVRCCRRGWFLGVAVTRFGPCRPMTRGMLAAVLHRVARSPSLDRRGFFLDVSPRAYYGEAADWCACRGLMEGGGNGRFFPDRSLSWEELALGCGAGGAVPERKTPLGMRPSLGPGRTTCSPGEAWGALSFGARRPKCWTGFGACRDLCPSRCIE